jgi:hypothetical protein
MRELDMRFQTRKIRRALNDEELGAKATEGTKQAIRSIPLSSKGNWQKSLPSKELRFKTEEPVYLVRYE